MVILEKYEKSALIKVITTWKNKCLLNLKAQYLIREVLEENIYFGIVEYLFFKLTVKSTICE
jgi:hypothetical protein